MTVAVTLKVNDGLVLSADSASTMLSPAGVENVYNNANKVFNLRKGLPIGMVTWGLGSLGGLSISILAKDLRVRLSGEDKDHPDWKLDPDDYTVKQVAELVKKFFYDEHYVPEQEQYEKWAAEELEQDHVEPFPNIGFMVAGYSSGSKHADAYLADLHEGECSIDEVATGHDGTGVYFAGLSDPINRVVNGYGEVLPLVLQEEFEIKGDDLDYMMNVIAGHLSAQLVNPGMPFQDAIELAEFLVGLTIGYSRFTPGAPLVGGPVETAAITKHEGFKWVKRKHFYEQRLNPPEDQ